MPLPSSLGNGPLSAAEARVLGCLLEKEATTPDNYPLSLNSLRLACNQTTSRDPVVDYDEATVKDALHRLERRGLARFASGAGSRAAKYRHLLAQRLPLEDHERALITVLLLRGAQTPGELKQRTDRMRAFSDLEEVHVALEVLADRGLAESLGRGPGQKEDRWRELLTVAEDERGGEAGSAHPSPEAWPAASETANAGETPAAASSNGSAAHDAEPDAGPAPAIRGGDADARIGQLAARVERLEGELEAVRAELREALSRWD